MIRVDFLHGVPNRLVHACGILERHVYKGRRVVVYCADQRRLQYFDKLLWSFEDASFIPHARASHPLAAQAAVLMTSSLQELGGAAHDGWLLNLDLDCPPWLAPPQAPEAIFGRVLEIVSQHPDDIHAARRRWQSYKQSGLQLHSHQYAQ